LYDGHGNLNPGLKVSIPTAGNGPAPPMGLNGPGSPTGIVWNPGSGFLVQAWSSICLFATLDGTISGWAPQANFNQAILAVDNSKAKASYTGLAVSSSGNMLCAANIAAGTVEVYDSTFNPVNTPGAFTDPNIPAGFAPCGIQDLHGEVYVTYAATNGGNDGFVDKYTESGTLILVNGKSFMHGAPLNRPWGVTVASKNFGPLSNTILVSNNTNRGTINAFNAVNGQFVGTVKDTNGKAISIDQLWGIGFGDGTGANGGVNQLFFTAGPSNNLAGTLGNIVFTP
jgi:uncharacterized protein (TIGR03118 family)